MFVILITYKKPLEVVDKYLSEHAAFLERGYENDCFIVSGRKIPRTGGVIFSQLKDRGQLEGIIKQDPFHIHGIAEYEIIEFVPGKYHPKFALFVN